MNQTVDRNILCDYTNILTSNERILKCFSWNQNYIKFISYFYIQLGKVNYVMAWM